jgi:bifunctional non-homologous end joining protein LigD
MPLNACKVMQSYEFEGLRGDWLMEPKIDGWRMEMHVAPNRVQAWTRTAHDATGKMPGVEHHLKHLAGTGSHEMRLDGEAVYVDEDGVPDYNFTGRCLLSSVDVCVMKQREVGSLTYFVFDILMLDGEDLRPLPLDRRKDILKGTLSATGNVEVVLGDEPTYEQHVANFDQYKEGSVLKDLSAPYVGRRHKSWLKWKEVESVDAKIVGFKRGQGKYEGLVGAIRFEAPDGTQGYCSGMDDTTRVWITDHRRELIGKIIEVKHFGKLVDGFRHPQFMRFREDKV